MSTQTPQEDSKRSGANACSSVFVGRVIYGGNRKVIEVHRRLPELPKQVSWHKGLMIDLGEELFEVDSVHVSTTTGGIRVFSTDNEYSGDWCDDERAKWEQDGWKVY